MSSSTTTDQQRMAAIRAAARDDARSIPPLPDHVKERITQILTPRKAVSSQ